MRKQVCINLAPETHERLKQYAKENHISSVSGAIEHLAWQAKLKEEQSTNKNK